MNKQIILRPVFNRPETLYLSIEYEVAARNYYNFPYDLTTVFLIEHGTSQKVLDLVKEYPFEKEIIIRKEKYGLSKNILLGMKEAFELANAFVVYIESDVLIWKHYFQFMNVLLNMGDIGKWSVLSPYNHNDNGDVNEVYRGQHYAALAPLLNKKFFMNYIIHCITPNFYKDFASRDRFVRTLGEKFKDNKLYKYRNNPGMHNEQAGLINRLCSISLIQENMAVIQPKVNRQIHIGFGGKNRHSKLLIGNSFDERLEHLREIIKTPEGMYDMTLSKQYNDYKIFSPKLNKWDGSLYIE